MAEAMHRLILMRHAQAEASAPSGGDEARPLSAAGRAEALLMGRALAERGLKPDLALVSTAVRTRQTWEQMHDAFGDVEHHDVAELLQSDEVRERAADLACADQRNLVTRHVENPLGETAGNSGLRGG